MGHYQEEIEEIGNLLQELHDLSEEISDTVTDKEYEAELFFEDQDKLETVSQEELAKEAFSYLSGALDEKLSRIEGIAADLKEMIEVKK